MIAIAQIQNYKMRIPVTDIRFFFSWRNRFAYLVLDQKNRDSDDTSFLITSLRIDNQSSSAQVMKAVNFVQIQRKYSENWQNACFLSRRRG